MALAGNKCLVKVSGTALTFTNEATTANEDFTVYQITSTTKRVWDRTATITVEKSTDGGTNWSTVSSGYTIDRLFGKVIFTTALTATDQVRVSGSYLPMSTVAEAYSFSWTLNAENLDRTKFGDSWRLRTQGLKDASGNVAVWGDTTSIFFDELNNGAVFVLEFVINNSVDMRAWALLSTDENSASVDAILEESIEWEGTIDNDGRMVSFAA